jgi:cytochrome d ubiquinol oxidase subunit II
MGTVIGGIAAGKIPGDATHATLSSWTGATSLLIGFLFVSACGYLAAVYLIGEAARRGDLVLERYFTHRAQAAGIVTGALSLATLLEVRSSNRTLFNHLTGRALPLVIVAGSSGLAVLALLTAGRKRGVRVLAALGVAAVVWGWGVAQYPVLLPGSNVTLNNAGAPHTTLVAIVVLFSAVAVLVGPAFLLLFSLQGDLGERDDGETALATGGQRRSQPPGGSGGMPSSGDWLTVAGLAAVSAIVHAVVRRRKHG